MRPRTLLIIAAVFVAVVAFYVVFEKVYLPRKEKQKEEENKVFTLTREDLDLIRIETETNKIILLKEKDTDRWTMTAPIETDTDVGEVESFIASALDATIGRKLGTKADLKESLDDFGLTKPKLTVVLGSGDKSEALMLGNAAPSGDDVYAMRKGDDQVFLVSSIVMGDLDKDTTTLRDKALVAFSPEDVTSFSVSREGKTVTVKKQSDGTWMITKPIEYAADEDQVNDILDFVSQESAVGFGPADATPAEYGLDRPEITLLLVASDGATSRLLIGKTAGDGDYWAMREGSPSVFMVSEKLKNKLTVSADFIMNRSLFAVSVPDVTSIELTGEGGAVSIVRDGQGWKITKPEATRGDRNAVNSLLGDLSAAKLDRIVQKPARDLGRYGLDKPTLTLTAAAKAGDKKQTWVVKLARGEGDTSYGYLSAGDFIFSIPTETIAGIGPTFESLKDRSLLSFASEDVTRVEVVKGDTTYVFKKKGDAWKMTEPERAKVEADTMDALLASIADVSYSGVLAETKVDLKTWGLDKPSVSVTLTGKDDKEIGVIKLGEEKSEKEGTYRSAISSSRGKIYSVNGDLIAPITDDIDRMQEGR